MNETKQIKAEPCVWCGRTDFSGPNGECVCPMEARIRMAEARNRAREPHKFEPLVASRWIRVAERRPDIGDTVLAFTPGQHVIEMVFASMGQSGTFYCFECGRVNVTHWMPLPEPPVEPSEEGIR